MSELNRESKPTTVEEPVYKNKYVTLVLCLFFGFTGAHKFYEGKYLLGFIYLFSLGLVGIGIVIDFISLIPKPNPYIVNKW